MGVTSTPLGYRTVGVCDHCGLTEEHTAADRPSLPLDGWTGVETFGRTDVSAVLCETCSTELVEFLTAAGSEANR